LRIKTLPLFNTSFIRKGFANLLLPYQYKKAINGHFGNICFDLVITPTPPITFIETACYLKNKCNSKVYLILRDIFPQNARDLGLIRNNFIFNYFRRQEKKLYKIADAIGCMSEKNIDYVKSHNPEVKINKLHLLENWSSVREVNETNIQIKSIPEFRNKFVLIFGGNFGVPQKIEFLIEVAERLKQKKEILFLLVGNGTEKSKIKNLILEKKVNNIKILNQLPREKYMELLKECDVGLVNLSDKFTIPNIPSRTLSYWSLKLPVLAAVDNNTDFGDLLRRSNGGMWSITGNVDDYISNLLFLYSNPEKRKQMGKDGYRYLINELNTEKAYNIIITKVSNI
jgi:glycosyltransferase involved in cell wall biosynthesis